MSRAGRAGAALLLAAAALGGCGGGGQPAAIALPEKPAHIAGGVGGPFAVTADGRVFPVAAASPRRLARVAPAPRGVATARGSVWVAAPHAVVRIDPNGSRPAIRLPSRAGLTGLAASGNAVWTLAADGSLTRLDPERAIRSGAIPAALPNSRAVAIAAAPGAVWVVDAQGRLIQLDALGRRLRWIGVGKDPVDVAAGAGFAWVARADGTVLQVRPGTRGWRVRRIRGGDGPVAIAFGGGRAWLAGADGRLLALYPASGHQALIATVGAGVRDVAYSEGSVWVARGRGRGGEIVEVSP
jgi:hypothetical protein